MSELGVRPIRFWAQMSSKQTQKNLTARNSASELMNPLKMGKKTCQALESVNSDIRDRSQAEITMQGHDEHETDKKNWTSTNSYSELTNPLEMVKKTIQAFELFNSDIRARSQAQITILGQDEHETDVKNRTSTNSVSDITNPFEIVKEYVRLWNR